MVEHIYKCNSCNKYTLEGKCPTCKVDTFRPLPPKFSPDDKYGKYRREIKREELKKQDLY